MKTVHLGQLPDRIGLVKGDLLYPELLGVKLNHKGDGPVVKESGHHGHGDDIKVGDLEKFSDQKGCSPESRGRQDCPDAAGRQKTARGIFAVPCLCKHRITDRTEGDCGGHAASGRTAEEEGGECYRSSRTRWFSAHGGKGEVDKEFAGAGVFEDGAVDSEEDNKGGRDVNGHPEYSLHGHVHVPYEPVHIIASVGPGRWQPRPDKGVDDKKYDHARHDEAG